MLIRKQPKKILTKKKLITDWAGRFLFMLFIRTFVYYASFLDCVRNFCLSHILYVLVHELDVLVMAIGLTI